MHHHINLLREEFVPLPEPVKIDKDAWLVFFAGLLSLVLLFASMIVFG